VARREKERPEEEKKEIKERNGKTHPTPPHENSWFRPSLSVLTESWSSGENADIPYRSGEFQ